MTNGSEACPHFLEGVSNYHERGLFKPKNRGFEDQIDAFLLFFMAPRLARYVQFGDAYHGKKNGMGKELFLLTLRNTSNIQYSSENISLDLKSDGCIIKLNLLKRGNGSAFCF